MKKLAIILICLALTINVYSKQKEQKLGYFVCISTENKHAIEKTESILEVYTILNLCFPGNCIDIEKQLWRTNKPVFEMYSGDLGIYVELKIITGVKKNGKLKMRRYKERN